MTHATPGSGDENQAKGGSEWLEADGLGGFASGTVSGARTRRYHALLLSSTPAGRHVLINGVEAWVETEAGSEPLTTHRYQPGVDHPDGRRRIESFDPSPWPRWIFRLDDGRRVEHQIIVPGGARCAALSWRLLDPGGAARLRVRILCSGRDYHATHHENGSFAFAPRSQGEALVWRFYPGLPEVRVQAGGAYEHDPVWYRRFLYEEERARGLDDTEDLASPGSFVFDLGAGEAALVLETVTEDSLVEEAGALDRLEHLRQTESARRAALGDRLTRAADSYRIRSGGRRTLIAGYPWFTDWGRDTFIALRGLCLSTGRLEEAREILVSWASAVSEGMLPNLFPDGGGGPEFNAVDASLWYIVAAGEYLDRMAQSDHAPDPADRDALRGAIEAILDGYARGTRFGIHADSDGLLASGAPGMQLTWMDARIGDWVVTPRRGKPVEVQALWLNALAIGAELQGGRPSRWGTLLAMGRQSFASRFWNDARGCLFDVVDVDGEPGRTDASLRPNQIFAVGGLPLQLLDAARARSVVDVVERCLLTPLGLRSLAPGEPGYAPRYEGGPRERDAVYHQGTVWPWLMGPFVEAWVRTRGHTAQARAEARARFLEPLLARMDAAGLGHLPEIADAEPPHAPKGCPFQAWSVSEALRLERDVLADPGVAELSGLAVPGATGVSGAGRRPPGGRRMVKPAAGRRHHSGERR